MKSLIFIALLFNFSTHATEPTPACKTNATRYVRALSRISYRLLQEGSVARVNTTYESTEPASNGAYETFLIESWGNHTDPLHCTYRIKMNKNVTGDCWMDSIQETECSG